MSIGERRAREVLAAVFAVPLEGSLPPVREGRLEEALHGWGGGEGEMGAAMRLRCISEYPHHLAGLGCKRELDALLASPTGFRALYLRRFEVVQEVDGGDDEWAEERRGRDPCVMEPLLCVRWRMALRELSPIVSDQSLAMATVEPIVAVCRASPDPGLCLAGARFAGQCGDYEAAIGNLDPEP